MLTENKFSKYLLYAIGEIVLVVIGILIALWINNWNQERKENNLENDLIDVLISDLKSKKAEFVFDLATGKSIILKSDSTINHWKINKEIDTTNLKFLINTLTQDEWFFNEGSSIYTTISSSGLWKKLPDSLNNQIDDLYRLEFGFIKSSFIKQGEYALDAKSNFLAPNHLLDFNKDTQALQTIVTNNDDDFISYVQLFKSGVIRLTSKFQMIIPYIDKLIENLEQYKRTSEK